MSKFIKPGLLTAVFLLAACGSNTGTPVTGDMTAASNALKTLALPDVTPPLATPLRRPYLMRPVELTITNTAQAIEPKSSTGRITGKPWCI
jgi:hypothetical protein